MGNEAARERELQCVCVWAAFSAQESVWAEVLNARRLFEAGKSVLNASSWVCVQPCLECEVVLRDDVMKEKMETEVNTAYKVKLMDNC